MVDHKLGDGGKVVLTDAEIAQRQAEEAAWNAGAFDRAMVALRSKRNALLKESDHTVLQDSPLTAAKKSEWMTYRTALRNLTLGLDTIEKVNNVAYPLKPSK